MLSPSTTTSPRIRDRSPPSGRFHGTSRVFLAAKELGTEQPAPPKNAFYTQFSFEALAGDEVLCPFGEIGLQTIPPECSVTRILARAYKRNRKCLYSLIKMGRGSSFCAYRTLTASRQSSGNLSHADSIGGKGGTRTLDPGIMRPVRPPQAVRPFSNDHAISGFARSTWSPLIIYVPHVDYYHDPGSGRTRRTTPR
jgi:hypothetical protein